MKAIFPLWERDTAKLAMEFIEKGFLSIITCSDSKVLDRNIAGSFFTKEFLACLPDEVDPCGENGEFHSFVFDGPLFAQPVQFSVGQTVLRDNRFYFCDLIAN
jgi:diphthamide synthase (EF-2-diphthine--ammonia ligase)